MKQNARLIISGILVLGLTYALGFGAQTVVQTQFEQVEKGWVVRQAVYNRKPKGYQGLAVNLRNSKFQDIRVRQALGYLLNREAMNEKFMYNQYFLLNSYYPDLYPNNINPDQEVTPYNPDLARKLLADAGWVVNNKGKLEKDGQVFEIGVVCISAEG